MKLVAYRQKKILNEKADIMCFNLCLWRRPRRSFTVHLCVFKKLYLMMDNNRMHALYMKCITMCVQHVTV